MAIKKKTQREINQDANRAKRFPENTPGGSRPVPVGTRETKIFTDEAGTPSGITRDGKTFLGVRPEQLPKNALQLVEQQKQQLFQEEVAKIQTPTSESSAVAEEPVKKEGILSSLTKAVATPIDLVNTAFGGGKAGDVVGNEELISSPAGQVAGGALGGSLLLAGVALASPYLTATGTTATTGVSSTIQTTAKTLKFSKAFSLRNIATLGGAGTIVKLQAGTAKNILQSSQSRAEEIIKEVESGSRNKADADVEMAQVLKNINSARNTAKAWSLADIGGFLGLKDTLIDFTYAQPEVDRYLERLEIASQTAQINTLRTQLQQPTQ